MIGWWWLAVGQSKTTFLKWPIRASGGQVLVNYGRGHHDRFSPGNQRSEACQFRPSGLHGWRLLGYRAERSRSGADQDMLERYHLSDRLTLFPKLVFQKWFSQVSVSVWRWPVLVVAQLSADRELICKVRVVMGNLTQPVVGAPAHTPAYVTETERSHPGPGPGGVLLLCVLCVCVSAFILPRLSSSGVTTLRTSFPKCSSSRSSDLGIALTPRGVDPRPDSGLGSTPVSHTHTHTD